MKTHAFSSSATSISALVVSALVLLAASPARAIDINSSTIFTSATTGSLLIATGGKNGDLTITGSPAVFTGTTNILIGSSGTGTLNIENSASLAVPATPSFYVGNTATGVGTINVKTGGTIAANTSSTWLHIGYDGIGTVNLDGGTNVGAYNGSMIAVNTLQIGFHAGSSGTANITNGGVLTAPNKINVGVNSGGGGTSTGVMNLSNGSSASSDGGVSIGRYAGATGTVNLTLSSTISSAGYIAVGDEGAGTMNLSGTSSAVTTGTASYISIGNVAGASGTLTADNNSSLNTPKLYVGRGANGTLTLTNGASVSATTFILGQNSGVSGVLNIGSTNGTAEGGTITTGTITTGTGSGTINLNQTDHVSLSASIQGNIAVNQKGTGTSTLTGTNNYTGKTTVSSGTLLVDGTVSASAIEVTGGTLGGSGTINGATIDANGTLAPGDASLSNPGFKLTSTGAITSAGTLAFTLNSTSEYSQLALGSNLLTLNGGNLQLTLTYSLSAGDQFELITGGTVSGAFLTLNGITLVGNQAVVGTYTFQVDYNTAGDAVSLMVVAVPEPGTWALMTGGIGILAFWQRRRSSRHSMPF